MKVYITSIFLFLSHFTFSQCFPDRHTTNWFDGWVSCEKTKNPNKNNPNSHWILYDLGAKYELDKMKLWNYNDPSNLNFGAKTILIEYSEDSIKWTKALLKDIDKASGKNDYEGMDWFKISIPRARYILLTIEQNYGATCAGLSEVKFSAEKITVSNDDQLISSNSLSTLINPNPFNDHVRILINTQDDGELIYQISSMYGQIIHSNKIRMNKSYYYLELDTKAWIPGPYQLQITKGNEKLNQLLIKI